MTLKLNGTNSEAAPAYAGDDADTGLQCGTNELKLVTGGTARATVDSSGRLGLGTTSPSYTTHINSSGATSLGVTTSSGSSEPQILLEDTAASDYFALQKNGRALLFKPQGSEKCRITSDGLTFNGDTAATNALDDYEEGTFDAFATVAGSFTGESTGCSRYTKIGNLVYIDLRVLWTGTSGGGGIQFDLPFAQAGTSTASNGHTGIVFYSGTSVDSSAISTHVPRGGTKVSFYRTDGGSFSGVNRSNVNGSYDWIASFSYFTG